MALLPGQQLIGGVSNLIFGTNTPNYDTALYTNTNVQAQMKAAGVTIIRASCNDSASPPNNYSDAQLDTMMNAILATGAVPLLILRTRDSVFNQHVVTHFKGTCFLYEHGNEPDINGYTAQSYFGYWQTSINACRAIDPGAKFIGPVLGVFSNVSSFLLPWLDLCVSNNVMPDLVSYHIYPDTTKTRIPQAQALQDAAKIGSSGATLRTQVKQRLAGTAYASLNLAMCCTEYNCDAWYNNSPTDPNQPSQGYTSNAPANNSFNGQFMTNALEGLVANNIDMACHFELEYYLANKNGPTSTAPQYVSLASEITKYLSGSPAAIAASPLALNFSGIQGGTNPAAQNVTLTNTGGTSGAWTSAITYGTGGSGWLSVTPGSGTLAAGANQAVAFTANLTGLAPGTYSATVTFSMGSSTATVTVQLVVTAATAPVASVSTSAINFTAIIGGSSPPSQTVTLTNTGTASGTWNARTNGLSWFSISLTTGTLAPGASVTITASINIAGLTQISLYVENIAFTFAGQIPETDTGIYLTLNAGPPPGGDSGGKPPGSGVGATNSAQHSQALQGAPATFIVNAGAYNNEIVKGA